MEAPHFTFFVIDVASKIKEEQRAKPVFAEIKGGSYFTVLPD